MLGDEVRSREDSPRVSIPFRRIGLLPVILSATVLFVFWFIAAALLSDAAFPSPWVVWVGLVFAPSIVFGFSFRPRAWFENGHFVVRSYFWTRQFDLAEWSLSAEGYAGVWTQWIEAEWIGVYQISMISVRARRNTSVPATMTTRKGAEYVVALSQKFSPPDGPLTD